MEFRVLKKNNHYFPQRRKKWQIRWRYYSGHPYLIRRLAMNSKDAWKIIAEHEHTSEDEWDDVWKPTLIGLGIAGIIGIVLLIMRMQGLI